MADLVRYAAKSAIPDHRRFQQFGGSTKAAGAAGRKTVINGYIASTVVVGDNSVTTVIDPPAHIVWFGTAMAGDPPSLFYALRAPFGTRDTYTPNYAVPGEVDFSKAGKLSPGSYQFVAPDYNVATDATVGFNGLPMASGSWLYGLLHRRIPHHTEAGFAGFGDMVITAFGVSWATPAPPVTGSAIVQPDGLEPGARKNSRVVCIPALSIAAAAGRDTLRIAQTPNNVFIASLFAVDTPVDGVLQTDLFTAVGARDFSAPTPPETAVLLVGKVTLAETPSLPIAWGAAINIGLAYVGGGNLNVVDAVGLHVGDVVTVVSVAVQMDGFFSDTRLITLSKTSGSVLTNVSMAQSPTYAHPICSTRDALWVAVASTTLDTIDTCVLHRVVDGVSAPVDLDGWSPLSALLPGTSTRASGGAWKLGAMAPGVIDLGENRLGVVACPPGSYDVSTSVEWQLLEVDATTLEVVGARGVVGLVSISSLVNFLPRRITLTVVSEQVVVEDVITKPAVLLKGVNNETFISTDGGYEWVKILSGLGAHPYYFGNSLHSFKPSETL